MYKTIVLGAVGMASSLTLAQFPIGNLMEAITQAVIAIATVIGIITQKNKKS